MGLGQHICLSQHTFHTAGRKPVCSHHNHMMLKPIPNIMTTSCCISHLLPLSNFSFSLLQLLPLISFTPTLKVFLEKTCAILLSLFHTNIIAISDKVTVFLQWQNAECFLTIGVIMCNTRVVTISVNGGQFRKCTLKTLKV